VTHGSHRSAIRSVSDIAALTKPIGDGD
jgi:hypothetical protein